MPSPKTLKKTKKNPTRKSLGYKIKQTFRDPVRTASKKVNKMKSRRLQKNNNRRAKKILRITNNSRPTLLAMATNIQPWYVPGKKIPVNFDNDKIRYANPRTSAILHTLRVRNDNDKILRRARKSPIRLDDPWGQMMMAEMKRISDE